MSWPVLAETWSTSQDWEREKRALMIWIYCQRFYKFKTFVATNSSIKTKTEFTWIASNLWTSSSWAGSAVTFEFNVFHTNLDRRLLIDTCITCLFGDLWSLHNLNSTIFLLVVLLDQHSQNETIRFCTGMKENNVLAYRLKPPKKFGNSGRKGW